MKYSDAWQELKDWCHQQELVFSDEINSYIPKVLGTAYKAVLVKIDELEMKHE